MSPKCQKLWGKDQDNNPLNVGDVREITCTDIDLIEEKGGLCTTFKRLIQLKISEEACQGSMHPWTTSKLEFQSHMIEVEGKINDQPIAILIDSGASHSYIDPNLV
jgi:hypothetical protein